MFKKISLAIAAAMLVVAAALIVSHVGALSVAPSPALAGSGSLQASTSDSFSGVSVTGTGKVGVKPNIATSSIGIEVTATTLADATSQANAKMAAVIDKIKSFGVADKDIQTVNYNVQPITEQPKPNGGTPRITGYNINNQVSVTVRKIDDLGKILDAAVAAGANNIYGVSFSIDDPTPYQQQARAAAVKDAMDKASQLAKAGGVTLGKIVWISEGSIEPRPVLRAAAAPSLGGGAAVPVETGQLEIAVSVDMRFALP
ncbi:MAG TPA: SIMPL domain-containing protein [Anaerolineae bacterium]